MKRSLVIFFTVVYLVSSAGINVNLHYCGGKIKSISFFHTDEADCCGPRMKKKKNCCHERSFVYNLKDDQHRDKAVVVMDPVQKVVALVSTPQTFVSVLNAAAYSSPELPPPPNLTCSGIYLENRVLRI